VAAARRVILLGPPNSGKGTQARFVAERLGIPHISTGDMLREARDAGTELGERVKGLLANGVLVDDDTMADLVAERLSRPDARDGFLLDGYPRTIRQFHDLDRILEGSDVDAVLLIEVPEEVLVERGLDRGREDDTEEVIRKRIRVYHQDTEPVVDRYRNSGRLEKVDGNRPIAEVTEQVLEALGVSRPTAQGTGA